MHQPPKQTGSEASATRESENAGGADDVEGWGKLFEVCGGKRGLGKKVSAQQPFCRSPLRH